MSFPGRFTSSTFSLSYSISRGANAGGYCHRSNPRGPFGSYAHQNYVWFSDEMTPRYEYRWRGPSFFLAASLRTYCYAHCWCNSVGRNKTATPKFTVWQFLRNHQLVMHTDGSIDYGKRSPLSRGIYDKIATVLPPQSGSTQNTAGTCGPDGKQFCPSTWPTDVLGAIPRSPPFSTEIGAPVISSFQPANTHPTKNMTVCGARCSAQSDCSTSVSGNTCDCAFPNPEDAGRLGLDPVSPPSICLALDTQTFGVLSTLFGRDEKIQRYVDEQGVPYRCRCNSTYTGNECCGSQNGMVWLANKAALSIE